MSLIFRPLAVWSFVLVGSLLLGGCASMGEMVGHNSVDNLHAMSLPSVAARTYAAPVNEVKQAILFSLKESGLENISEHQTADSIWYATGEVGYSWRSNGQFVRMAAKPVQSGNSPKTSLLYNSIKRFEVNVTEDLVAVRDKLINLVDSYIESR